MTTTTALITGAGSGIGRALASRLAGDGVHVIVADIEGSAGVADDIRRDGGSAEAARLDVTRGDDVRELVASVNERRGLDFMINNAGVAVAGETTELDDADWSRVLDVNLRGVINGATAAYAHMRRAGHGHIVNIASVAGLAPYPLALPYTTSKQAVVGLSLALRAEARHSGVRVSVACPGAIDTPIWKSSPMRGEWNEDRLRALVSPKTTAAQCADAIWRGVLKNRGVIPVTLEARAAWALHRLSPRLSGWIAEQMCRRVRAINQRS